MVIGKISKRIQNGLMYMDRDPAVREVLQKFVDNPKIDNFALKFTPHYKEVKDVFGSYDALKYAAWNMDPATYDYELSKSLNPDVDKKRDDVVRFCKVAVDMTKSEIYRHKEFPKFDKLIGSALRIKELSSKMYSALYKSDERRRSRRIVHNPSTFRDEVNLKESMHKRLGSSYELGSHF